MEILSRCGIDCSSCKYKEILGCKGCANLDRPFWGECEVKDCCEDRGFETCGQCHKCPCDVLTEMASDPKEGDGGLRIRNTRQSLLKAKKTGARTSTRTSRSMKGAAAAGITTRKVKAVRKKTAIAGAIMGAIAGVATDFLKNIS